MSHLLLPLIDCPQVQADLNYINECKIYPRELTPLTEFLLSDINSNRVLETTVSPGAGKIRTAQVVFTPRAGEGEVDDTLTTDCENTHEAGMDSETYEIDETNGVEWKESLNFANLARICKSNPQYLAERINAGFDVLARKMETKVTNQAALLYGKFVTEPAGSGINGTNDLKTIATKYADGKFTEDAMQEIMYSVKNSGFCNTPFIFGDNLIYKYMQKAATVCCADTGVDIEGFMQQFQAMFYQSYRVPTALGLPQGFLAIDPGSLYILQYNKFAEGSGLETNADNFLRMGTLVDPKTGIEYNYKIYLNPCGEKLNLVMSTAFKVVALPSTFTGGDRYFGTNGILRFNVSNPA